MGNGDMTSALDSSLRFATNNDMSIKYVTFIENIRLYKFYYA